MEEEQKEVFTTMKLFSITATMDTGWWEVEKGAVWSLEPGVAVVQNVMVS